MSESNICEICGGIKQIWYKVEILTAEQVAAQAVAPTLPDPVPASWQLCPGHPEPASDVVSPWLIEQVHLAIGRASMCWHTMPSGVFDDAQAKAVAERLIQAIASEQGKHIPEPAQKHDGSLGKDGDAKVQHGAAYPGEAGIYILENKEDDPDHCFVYLGVSQALSLRDWLIQESPELERLAKEQTRG